MKTALYFGSFNPMHLGHITICRYLLEKTEIDQLRLVVSPGNPLKSAENFKNAQQRLICAQNIIKEEFPNYNIVVSDIEFQLAPPLYTINTIRYLKESEPGNQFILVIGSDNLAIIEKWHKWQELLSETEIWVYPRKGSDARELCNKYCCRLLDAPLIDISSTEIREQRGGLSN